MLPDQKLKKLAGFYALPLADFQPLDSDQPQQAADKLSAKAESDLTRLMQDYSAQDSVALSFPGSVCYNNFIPAGYVRVITVCPEVADTHRRA